MTEILPEYTDLEPDKRQEVLQHLAQTAIDIIANHPDARADDVECVMKREPYGHIAWLAISRAIKAKVIIADHDGASTRLRIA